MNLRKKAEVQKDYNSLFVQEPGLGKMIEGEIAVKQQDESLTEDREKFQNVQLETALWA